MNEVKTFLEKVKTKFNQKYNFYIKSSLIITAIVLFTIFLILAFSSSIDSLYQSNHFLKLLTNIIGFSLLPSCPLALFLYIKGFAKMNNIEKSNVAWLKAMLADPIMYKLSLIKCLKSQSFFSSLDSINLMINSIDEKKAINNVVKDFEINFAYEKTEKEKLTFINKFLKDNEVFINQSIEELESLLKEKIEYCLQSKQKTNSINNFLNDMNKTYNKTLALKI